MSEVLRGAREDSEFATTRQHLLEFQIFDTGGLKMAVQTAEKFRRLRKRGYTVRKMIDCWIATLCIREGHLLLHRDRDFGPFEQELGLRVIKP